jgi:hypothetical protein
MFTDGRNVHLVPAVKIDTTNVSSTNKQVINLMKVQEAAYKVFELSTVIQIKVYRNCLWPTLWLLIKRDTVILISSHPLKPLRKSQISHYHSLVHLLSLKELVTTTTTMSNLVYIFLCLCIGHKIRAQTLSLLYQNLIPRQILFPGQNLSK